jgi:hypothetical protein
VKTLSRWAASHADMRQHIAATASKLVEGVRANRVGKGGVDAFLT